MLHVFELAQKKCFIFLSKNKKMLHFFENMQHFLKNCFIFWYMLFDILCSEARVQIPPKPNAFLFLILIFVFLFLIFVLKMRSACANVEHIYCVCFWWLNTRDLYSTVVVGLVSFSLKCPATVLDTSWQVVTPRSLLGLLWRCANVCGSLFVFLYFFCALMFRH